MRKRSPTSYEKSRLRELLWLMIQKHQPTCTVCGKEFIKEDVLPPRGSDLLTEHHVDCNHYNNELSNRTLVHRQCHKSYHTRSNINFWSQF